MSDATEAAGATRHVHDLPFASSTGHVQDGPSSTKTQQKSEGAKVPLDVSALVDAAAQAEFLAGDPADIAARLYHAEREKAERERLAAIDDARREAADDAAWWAGDAADDTNPTADSEDTAEGAQEAPGAAQDTDTAGDADLPAEAAQEAPGASKDAGDAQRAAQAKRDADTRARRDKCGAPHLDAGGATDVAAALERHYMAQTGAPHAYDQGALWTYDEASGTWRELLPATVHNFLQRRWHGLATRTVPRGGEQGVAVWQCSGWPRILEAFRDRSAEHGLNVGFFDKPPHGLAFADCFLRTDKDGNWAKEPKSPKWRARHGFNFACPVGAGGGIPTPDIWQRYLDMSVPDPTAQALLSEALGAALFGLAPKLEKATLLYGPGGTGKSTFLAVARAVVGATGPRACTSIQPQHWRNGHYLAGMVGSRLNACEELSTDDLGDGQAFKAVVTGGDLTANPKGLPNYPFIPQAAHIFAANTGQLPQVPGADEPFWDRWQCVPFNQVHRGTATQVVALAERIVAEALPGVVGWALRGIISALARRAAGASTSYYTRHAPGEAVIAEWRGNANAVVRWLAERTTPAPSLRNGERLTDAYKDLVRWCGEAGQKAPSRPTFAQRLDAAGVPRGMSDGSRIMLRLLPGTGTADDVDDWYNGTAN